jgi:hypothetical protein
VRQKTVALMRVPKMRERVEEKAGRGWYHIRIEIGENSPIRKDEGG